MAFPSLISGLCFTHLDKTFREKHFIERCQFVGIRPIEENVCCLPIRNRHARPAAPAVGRAAPIAREGCEKMLTPPFNFALQQELQKFRDTTDFSRLEFQL